MIGQLAGLKVEGASAAGVAALLQRKTKPVEGKKIILLLTGRNIDETVHTRVIRAYHSPEEKHQEVMANM